MSATIDHLSAHYQVKVLKPFTDARGLAVPEGATGVIRHIGLDTKLMEFTIDWERDGKPETLTFSLSAKDGPRNGMMRDYFEKGELVMPPRPEKPKPAEPPAAPTREVKRPDAPLPAFEGKQPQQELMLEELTVACDCGPDFHRSLWPQPLNLGANACLKCGAVTVTRQVGDDGRFTGNAWTAYWTVPTPQHIVDWLARFPRVAVDHPGAPWRWPMSSTLVRYPTLLYPANTRVRDAAHLSKLEDELWFAQKDRPRAERFRSIAGAIPPPPLDTPSEFHAFLAVKAALSLPPDTDFDTLRPHANLASPSSELAAALLLRRPVAYDTMMRCLRSKDDGDFSAGIAMLRDARPLFAGPDDPRLAPELLKLLDELPLGKLKDVPGRVESWFRFEALLVAIADLGANSEEMLDGLATLRTKIAAKDATVAEAIRIVINELNGVDNRPEKYR
ncbi:MAG TPA: hypothetical protein VGO52_07505 [Hyphomonadaceae bacterium]|nr:hypothetical protein [Hyphomonadaceae bacterium]